MGTREYIKNFRAGQRRLSAGHLNQLVKNARRFIVGIPPITVHDTAIGAYIGLDKTFGRFWIGEVQAFEAGDSDATYVVKKTELVSSDAENLEWSDVTVPSDFEFTVTNLPEEKADSHLLAAGRRVLVHETMDDSSPPTTRYVMAELPGPADGQLFAVTVRSDGGTTAGDASTQCDKTYTVWTAASDYELGSSLTPQKNRPDTGELSLPADGAYGTGFYVGSDFHLWDANESLATSDCS